MMSRGLLAVLLLIGTALPAWAQINLPDGQTLEAETLGDGSKRQGFKVFDHAGAVQVIDDTTDQAVAPLSGRRAASLHLAASTLDGTLVPLFSRDCVLYEQGGAFTDANHASLASIALDGSNAEATYGLVLPEGARCAGVKASVVTSGSVSATVTASTYRLGSMMYGVGGGLLRPLELFDSAPGAGTWAVPVRFVGSLSGGTSTTDDGVFTVGTSSLTPAGGIYRTTLDPVDDGDAGAFAMTQNRALHTYPVTATGDTTMDDTHDAQRVMPVTVVSIGGQTAPSGVATFTNCTQNFNERLTAIETRELVAAVTDQTPRLCITDVLADGDTDVTFVAGTGTDCGTAQETLRGPFDLTSTNGRGFMRGTGIGVVLYGVDSKAICVTSSAAVPLTVAGTSASY